MVDEGPPTEEPHSTPPGPPDDHSATPPDPAGPQTGKKADQPITRRRFLRRAGKYVAGTAAGLTGITYLTNNWTPPPDHPPDDYTPVFDTLDPKKPIGVLMVNVNGKKESWLPRKITHAAWNTYVREMNEHYGNNWIPISNASMTQLNDFSNQFNARFGTAGTEVHFVANHHQGHYSDAAMAAFLNSVQAKTKRAVIYACGPNAGAYNNTGCEYVILPRINQRLLGPELSFRLSPGYLDLIGMMRDNSSAADIRNRLDDRSYLEAARDKLTHQIWPRVWFFEAPSPTPDNHGAVVEPPGSGGPGR